MSDSFTEQRRGGDAHLSIEFSRQEYWSGLPFPSPGTLPVPGIEPRSLASPALAGRFFTSWATGEAPKDHKSCKYLLEWPASGRKCVNFLRPVAIHSWTGSWTKAPWFNIQAEGQGLWCRTLCMDGILLVNKSTGEYRLKQRKQTQHGVRFCSSL